MTKVTSISHQDLLAVSHLS